MIETSPQRLALVVVFLVLCVGALGYSLFSTGVFDGLFVRKTPMASLSEIVAHMPDDRREAAKRVIAQALKEYDAKNDKASGGYKEGREAVQLYAGFSVAGDEHGEGVLQRAVKAASGARNDGSKDVLVLAIPDVLEYYRGRSRSPGDLERHVGRVEALLGSGYPVACVLGPVGAGLNDLRRYDLEARPQETEFVTGKSAALSAAALDTLRGIGGSDLPPGYLVERAWWLLGVYRRVPGEFAQMAAQIDALLVEVGATAADLALYRGELLIASAWMARGTERPTAETTRVLREKLAEASAVLSKAADEAQNDPRLPALMITAEAGLNKGRPNMEGWFDRAVAADPKYREAYMRKMNFLQPNSRAAREAVVAFAKECVATGYWETNVPLVAVEGLMPIANASRDQPLDDATWDVLYGAASGAISKYPASVRTRTQLFAAAVAAKRWKVAREQYEILGANWDPMVLTEGGYNRARRTLEENDKG